MTAEQFNEIFGCYFVTGVVAKMKGDVYLVHTVGHHDPMLVKVENGKLMGKEIGEDQFNVL